jgi:hypothetical protein
MSRLRRLLMLLLLAEAPCAVAAEVQPGDQVRLIERDQHIPAPPVQGIAASVSASSVAQKSRSCR